MPDVCSLPSLPLASLAALRWVWLDPSHGIVGAIGESHEWAWTPGRVATAGVLLDQTDDHVQMKFRER